MSGFEDEPACRASIQSRCGNKTTSLVSSTGPLAALRRRERPPGVKTYSYNGELEAERRLEGVMEDGLASRDIYIHSQPASSLQRQRPASPLAASVSEPGLGVKGRAAYLQTSRADSAACFVFPLLSL